jgi:phosphate transport system substrate-binding protein
MHFPPRRTGILMLLLLLLFPGASQAQDAGEITVVGSGIVEPVLQALIEASEVEAAFRIDVTGTSTGFQLFCDGEADMTTATRPINSAETAACSENEIVPLELTLGHNILVFVSNPADAELNACLTGDELTTIYAPSSEGEITNWNQVLEEGPDLTLTAYAPGDISAEYVILDALIEGDGIRADVLIEPDAQSVIEAVSETAGAIGAVRLREAQAAGDSIRILEVDAAAIQGCQVPAAVAVEDNLYPAAETLYVYVNTDRLNEAGMQDFLEFALSDEAGAVVESTGFTSLTELALQTNQDRLEAAVSGELPVVADAGFTIPVGLTGQVNIGGAGEGIGLLQSAVDNFSQIAPGAVASLNVEGLPAGIRRLCNGEVDLVYTYRDLTAEEIANCEANNITLLTVNTGARVIVLVANANSDHLTCLTNEALTTIWSAQSTREITDWNQVSNEFPSADMTLFAPDTGSIDTDLLLAASGQSLTGRIDIHLDNDPLYRAAATANVEGALTFMNWFEYQDVLANNQANIQLVAVDAGEGCIAPDLNTIRSGEYPLTRPGKLVINSSQLARPEVQSVLWLMFSDDNFRTFEINGFAGLRLSDLATIRGTLLAAFEEASAAAAEAAEEEPEATSEATAEATAEATTEAE